MRVVHVSKVAGIAGSERHLLTLLPALRLRGIDTRMIVLEDDPRASASFCDRLLASGVPVERLCIRHDVDVALTAKLTTQLAAIGPDIVHTHLLHADLYGLRAAHALGIRSTVSTRHNTDHFRHNIVIRWLNRRAMQSAARIIAISGAVSRFVVSVEGCDAKRVVTIPYGFEPQPQPPTRAPLRARFGFTETDTVVAVVARLTRQKGVDVLVDAFARIHATHAQARLLIVGDGPDRAALEARVAAAGLTSCTTFAGWMEEAWKVMTAADIVAVPSRWEGFCLAAVEAMAASRPLVASDVDALSEVVIANETGLLVAPGEAAAHAAAITSLLDDPSWAARIGQQGALRAARAFPVAAMISATSSVYADLSVAADGTALAGAMQAMSGR